MIIFDRFRVIIIFMISLMLVGCPSVSDRLRPHEATKVTSEHDAICFQVLNSQAYQVGSIFIYLRGTPPKERYFIYRPNLSIDNGEMCIPHNFYSFPREGQFIVEYILTANSDTLWPRHVVVGVEFIDGKLQIFPLETHEFIN